MKREANARDFQDEPQSHHRSRDLSWQRCIRGLRYPVENVVGWLVGGMSVDDILSDYADLERGDILAALDYAARLAHINRVEPFAT